jgi:uncharacterized protein YciI
LHFHNRTIAERSRTEDWKAEAVYLRVEAGAATACGFSLDERRYAALERHFTRFQDAAKSGQLILAGRTSEPGDKTFGIAIFEAPDEDTARKFMQQDPAVAGGLMTAELHPFAVALQRKNPWSAVVR